MLEIFARKVGNITVLTADGTIKIGPSEALLREVVHKLISNGDVEILLNTKKVTRLDASGFGELVNLRTAVEQRGGHLKFLSVPPVVMDVLQITGLVNIFEVFENEDDALRSFA
jgi:anti-sigma B factor antagonist